MNRHRLFYWSMVLLLAVTLGSTLVACPSAPASPTAAPAAAPAKATAAPAVATAAPAATAPSGPAITTPVSAATTAAVPPAPALQPVVGTYTGALAQSQSLRTYMGAEPPTLDPSKAQDTTSVCVLTQMYEGLTRFRPDLTVEPAIAQSWTVSPDGKTWTFKLRSSKFSDGTPVTAKDFEYSWKRMLNPATGSPYAFVVTEEIVGAEAFNSAKVPTDTAKLPALEAAVGVKAVDDSTFQVTLNAPASYFLWLTALWNTVPLSKAAIDKGGDKWTEAGSNIGNGPFILKDWKHQASIVLTPNPNYWDKQPTLTNIEMRIITEPTAALQAYKNNELDIMGASVPQAEIPGIRSDPTMSKEVITGARLSNYYIGFNVTKAPFTGEKGKLVRQAISQAVDRKTLVDVINKGIGSPAQSFVPPGMPGHQPDIGFKYDPAAAKATLQKAGYADGAALGKIQLFYNTSASHKPIIEFIADQLKKNLGIDTDIQSMEWGAYLDLAGKDAPQMFRMGWNADYPHPADFLGMVFNSKSDQNYSKFNNAQFDKLVSDAAKETDVTKQTQMYNQAQQILVDEAPVLFVYWSGRFALAKPWVKDLIPTAQDPQVGEYFFRLTKVAQH